MTRIKLDPITDFARHGYDVKVTCEGCGINSHWNAGELAMELHRHKRSQRTQTVEGAMPCRECGKKGALIQLVLRS